MTFTGAITVTNLQNLHDLAPNYASALFGLSNTFAATSGFLTPLIVGVLTQENVKFYKMSIKH